MSLNCALMLNLFKKMKENCKKKRKKQKENSKILKFKIFKA